MPGDPGVEPAQVVLLQSDRGDWRELLTEPHRYTGKLLSELIVLTDNGPFSHCVLRQGERVIDARRPTEGGRAVEMRTMKELRDLPRNRSRVEFVPADGEPAHLTDAWDWIVAQPWFHDGTADPTAPPNQNRFTYGGLVLVAINLLTSEWRWLRAWGPRRLRKHRDLPGFFCSELIALSMVQGGVPLCVMVSPNRIPPAGAKEEVALVEMLLARRDRNVAAGSDLLDDEDGLRTAVLDHLAALRDDPGVTGDPVPVPVGMIGDDGPTMPPSLVTPNDIYRSPSFAYLDSDPPSLTPHERARRFRRWLLALAFAWLPRLLSKFSIGTGVPPPGPAGDQPAGAAPVV